MKIVIIGDTHAHTTWKDIVEKENYDKVIFLGDYFDNFSRPTADFQLQNFKEIVEFCEKNNSIVLLGNHEYHYMHPKEKYSGFSYDNRYKAHDYLMELWDKKILKPIHIEDNIIFSHAGVSKTWLTEIAHLEDVKEIEEKADFEDFKFNYLTGINYSGDTISSSPIWIRPNSLLSDKVDGYTQVVGHTPLRSIHVQDNVWFCDTMPMEYLVIKDGEFTIKNLKDL